MCVVENSGRFGGTYAAPIVSLMIEKYINDSIDSKRKPLVERMSGINLIPKLMLDKMRSKDSLQKARAEEKELKNEIKNIKDTLQAEDVPSESEVKGNRKKDNKPTKDAQQKQPVKTEMVAPEKQRKLTINNKDSVKE
jgi:penicillin-binding protein 2